MGGLRRSRQRTPSPESRFIGTAGVVFLIFGALTAAWAIAIRSICLAFVALPSAAYAYYLAHTITLLIRAKIRWERTNIKGILIYADSPNHKEYIESNWLPKIGDNVVVLNHSRKRRWPRDLAARVFDRFVHKVHYPDCRCPSVIVFRGLRYPLVFRFFYPFRNNKFGRPEALKKMEAEMFDAFQSH